MPASFILFIVGPVSLTPLASQHKSAASQSNCDSQPACRTRRNPFSPP